MSLEKATITWSAKQLSGMIKNDKIDFSHIIQRGLVWEVWRKSKLIESMIIGYPVPTVYAKRVDDGSGKRGSNIYMIMDGKQRLSTVKEFLNDEFSLSKLPSVTYMDEAFYGCEALTDAVFEEGMTTIPAEAFYYCTGLTSFSAPKVTTVGDGALKLLSNVQE